MTPDWKFEASVPKNNNNIKNNFLPKISFTPANVITSEATNKSAIARDAKNKFPIRRKLRSV